ncbi:hypothetical protein SLS60_006397 [Paraconiothyrium brasiliense]|uniref:C2H2-type domain-containing protein n=1 Tax=Paraconiothyrium brasiliense TaxID=300254 RepID=A0ABR3RC21_9PLEO
MLFTKEEPRSMWSEEDRDYQEVGLVEAPTAANPASDINNLKRGSASPFLNDRFQPYPAFNGQRRQSNASLHSQHSGTSRKSASSYELNNEMREKGLCPLPECGRVFKDLKAHMLTHQNERPEKCPITTCEGEEADEDGMPHLPQAEDQVR